MRVEVETGVELEVEVRGEGPTLVLVHGFGGAKEDFSDHVDALAARWRVVTFDLRGHGASDRPSEPRAYTLDRLALDVEAVADAVEVARVRLLGHSMGGMVVRRVVSRRPERVDALVLMSTAAGPPHGLDPDVVDLGARLALDDWSGLKAVLDGASPLGTAAYERLLAERPGFREYGEWKWSRLEPAMWSALAPQIAREPDALGEIATIGCPTLVMIGALDGVFYDASLAMFDALPDGRLAVFPDAGHHPQFESPDAWLEALTSFLADVDARQGVAGE